ncbi:DUF2442 domain-containing protein [Telluribacter sp.]|uniref:DUF2442 domain-containing protein n=1 Tax=Telluribacter sp. TaxID=1978767 RepID=UPI0039C993B8
MKVSSNHNIQFTFDDDTTKLIDFKPYIRKDALTSPLANIDYFKEVKIYERGRGIYWENGYDFCPDYLRRLEQSKVEAHGVSSNP